MEKEKYVKPTCSAILLTHQMQLLAGSYTDSTPPNDIPTYDDWMG